MKKFGFTLMEIIVTIGIIGVVAAITAPTINNIMPDKNKIKVMKAYKTLSDINAEIMDDKEVWQNSPTVDKGGWTHMPEREYPEELTRRLEVVQLPAMPARELNFQTVDGMGWRVIDLDGRFAYVEINTNDDKKDDCIYSASCRNPRRYSFNIEEDQLKITPADPLTAAFLANPNKLNDRKAALKTAKNDTKNYNAQY